LHNVNLTVLYGIIIYLLINYKKVGQRDRPQMGQSPMGQGDSRCVPNNSEQGPSPIDT
jgi:hypothetical protein